MVMLYLKNVMWNLIVLHQKISQNLQRYLGMFHIEL